MSIIRYHSVLDDFVPVSFSHLVDRFFNDSTSRSGGSAYAFAPKADIIENEKAFEIHLAVPGMKKEDFKVSVLDDVLTVEGERKRTAEKNEKYFRSFQTEYGSFTSRYELPDHVNSEGIEAKYEDGILTLTIPKNEKKLLKTTIEVA